MSTILLNAYAILIALVGLAYILPGFFLLLQGGTWYYLGAGLLLVISAAKLLKRQASGLTLLAALLGLTLLWTLYESGLDFWAFVPRLALLTLLVMVLLIPAFRRQLYTDRLPTAIESPIGVSVVVVLLVTAMAYISFMNSLSISPDEFASRERHDAHNAGTETNWTAYGNSRKGTRYSPAEQINRDNVDELELAWVYRTKVGETFKNTPIQVKDKLYACAAGNVIIALDAESGQEAWRFDAEVDENLLGIASYFTSTCRSVSFYEAPADYSGECAERILMGTVDARLLAVDANTGEQCRSFGDNGSVDLTKNMGDVPMLYYMVTSAPAIVRGNAVLGGWVLDNREVNEPSGVVRAFDAITGEFAWAWDLGRPGEHGEPQNGEIYTRGTPNVWSLFSVDEERGLVFAPTGNETPDYFGGQRNPLSEEYSSSVVALNGETGEVVWSFQTVHHDIWDYDAPSQPALVDVPDENGNLVPALLQATKRGEIFMLNRETGEPIAAVEERRTPQNGVVPEDWVTPTQPYSALPNTIAKHYTERDMWGITPFDHMWCRISFNNLDYEGHFTPPNTNGIFQHPGNSGGYNWGSLAVDEAQHIMVGSAMTLPNHLRLVPRAEVDAGAPASPQLGTPYGARTVTFVSPLGIPCSEPPFGMLTAIDLQTQDLLWKRPIGTTNDLGPLGTKVGLPLEIGTPVSGGTMVTKGGLVFFAGTLDRRFRAFDIHTGEELWKFAMPQSAQATPMTYVSPDSHQQTVIVTLPGVGQNYTVGVSGEAEDDPQGGYIMAFRLRNR